MEDTPQEIIEERHNSSRRDFLKKSAVTGAVVWSAPAISTLSSRAWAETYNGPGNGDCECDESAYALFATADGIIVGTVGPIAESGNAPDSASVADLSALNGLVSARLLASRTEECRAHAEVAFVKIDLTVLDLALLDIAAIEAEVLNADANGETCTGDSDILVVRTIKTDGTVNEVAIGADPNSEVVLDLGALGSITLVANEQSGNGSIAVNALHVFVNLLDAQTLDVIVSHAETTCC